MNSELRSKLEALRRARLGNSPAAAQVMSDLTDVDGDLRGALERIERPNERIEVLTKRLDQEEETAKRKKEEAAEEAAVQVADLDEVEETDEIYMFGLVFQGMLTEGLLATLFWHHWSA